MTRVLSGPVAADVTEMVGVDLRSRSAQGRRGLAQPSRSRSECQATAFRTVLSVTPSSRPIRESVNPSWCKRCARGAIPWYTGGDTISQTCILSASAEVVRILCVRVHT